MKKRGQERKADLMKNARLILIYLKLWICKAFVTCVSEVDEAWQVLPPAVVVASDGSDNFPE